MNNYRIPLQIKRHGADGWATFRRGKVTPAIGTVLWFALGGNPVRKHIKEPKIRYAPNPII